MRRLIAAGVVLAGVLAVSAWGAAAASTQIATDTTVDPASRHATLVEPDTFAFGDTIVASAQSGRYFDGGASAAGFATSTDGGDTWTSDVLPGITDKTVPPGPYDRLSDPSVAYDPLHDVWMVQTLALDADVLGAAVLVSRSVDGGLTWGNPVEVAAADLDAGEDFDKNWIVCDTWAASPFYGRCYAQWDDYGNFNRLRTAYSTDGGLTWSPGTTPDVAVLGGQPVVRPDGTVVMPIDDAFETNLFSFRSTDGGVTWQQTKRIARIDSHVSAGDLRGGPLPSAEVDGAGRVFVVWSDCRFRKHCGANDIVLSSSKNGRTWSSPKRIPIAPKNGTGDYFLPGIAVDPTTSGKATRIGVVYYYYADSDCDPGCQLRAGWISSGDGGKHWSAPVELADGMDMEWLPLTTQGRMIGDYMSASFLDDGTALPAFVIAKPPTGDPDCEAAVVCDVGLYAPDAGLAARAGGLRPLVDAPVLSTKGDRPRVRRAVR